MPNVIYQSYTYLIKFIPTGQVYYGVRVANKTEPENDLWKKYFTSSKYIKKLIKEYGAEWFEYEIRKIFDDRNKARLWEETVLKRMNVVNNNKWLNRTNNKCILQNEDTKRKQRQTCMKKYGVENNFQSEEIKENIKRSNLEKYGVEYASQRQECKDKIKKTIKKRYGVDHYFKVEEICEKKLNTNLERYGCKYPAQNGLIKEKMKSTTKERYGVEYYTQTEEYKRKAIATCLEKYGVENPAQSEIARQKNRQKYHCKECDFVSNKGNIVKHQNKTRHKDFYKLEEEV